jgi:O-antigen ligase
MKRVAYISVWLFVATVPLDRMFIGQFFGADVPVTVTQIFGLIAILVAIVATLFEGRLRRFERAHGYLFLFIFWACLSGIWSLDPDSSLARVVTYLQLAFMVWLLCQYAQSREEQMGFMLAYVCGAAIVAFQLFLGYALGGTVFSFEVYPGRFTSMGYNPNDLALTLAIGIPFAWYVFTNSTGIATIIAIAYMPAALAGILLSASRGGMFAAIVALLILPAGFFRMSHGRKVVVSVALALAIVLAVVVVPERSWERLMTIDDMATTRWSSESLQNLDMVNMRVAIWKEGLATFEEHPFLGVGVGGYINVVAPIEGERRVAHNVFLSILVELGLVGLILFISMIGVLMLSVRYMKKDERLMWLLLLSTYMVGGFFLSWEHTKQTWLIMGLLAARSVPLRAPFKLKRANIPNATKAVIAQHMERQRWERVREMAIDLLLVRNHLEEGDKTGVFLQGMVEQSEEWPDVAVLASYFEEKLGAELPKTVGEWRDIATDWAEDLRRTLVSDF